MARKIDFLNDKTKTQLQSKTAATRKQKTATTKVATRMSAPRRNDLLPDLEIVRRPIGDVKPAKHRARESTDEQLARVVHSIQTYGQMTPILIDPDDRIIAGHVVWEALAALGVETINCIVVRHLDDALMRAYAITANRTGETGSWVLEELKIELDDLASLDIDLEVTGFSLPEIDIIRLVDVDEEDWGGSGDNEDLPTISVVGDRYELDRHRLVCGDALESATYDMLMDGDLAKAVISDAPYNCPIEGFVSGLGKRRHKDFAQGVGEMSDEAFETFLTTYLDHCKAHCDNGAVIFAFMDWRQIDLLLIAGRNAALKRLHVVVWNKGVGAMGSLYRSAHEFVAVFCNGDRAATNNVQLGRHGRDRTSVWSYAGATQRGSSAAKALADHPTPKPVNMIVDAMLDVTNRGDIVLDPFLGSGTTLIAAERCDRIAYAIELDGKYVDRAIRRWETETGKHAVHFETGLTFSELTRQRLAECEVEQE